MSPVNAKLRQLPIFEVGMLSSSDIHISCFSTLYNNLLGRASTGVRQEISLADEGQMNIAGEVDEVAVGETAMAVQFTPNTASFEMQLQLGAMAPTASLEQATERSAKVIVPIQFLITASSLA